MKPQSPATSDGRREWQYRATGDDHLVMLFEDLEYWEAEGSEMAAMGAGRRKTVVPGLHAVLDLLTAIVFLLVVGAVLLIVCGWVLITWLILPLCGRGRHRTEPAERKQSDQPAERKAA